MMPSIKLLWQSATKWMVVARTSRGEGCFIERISSDCTQERTSVIWRRNGREEPLPWPGDPATAVECVAMAERVCAEQFGGQP